MTIEYAICHLMKMDRWRPVIVLASLGDNPKN